MGGSPDISCQVPPALGREVRLKPAAGGLYPHFHGPSNVGAVMHDTRVIPDPDGLIRIDPRETLARRSDDTNGTSLSANSYPFYVYVENHGFDLNVRTNEQKIVTSKYPCLDAKCSLLHICMLSEAVTELVS